MFVKNNYSKTDANGWRRKAGSLVADKDLGERVYTSRLIGLVPDLIMHGGGNTSVKVTRKNIFGKEEIKFQKEILNCTKLYLIEKKVLSKNGTIKNKDLVNKTKLWEYIMYIRSKNKNLTIFKDTLGKGNSVELYKLYLLLVKNVKERNLKDYKSSKDDLIKLIKIIIKQGPTLSFLKNYNPKTQSRKSPITKTKKTNNQFNNKPKISNIDITLKTNSGLERTTPQKANIKVDITKL